MAVKVLWSNLARENLLDIYVAIGVADAAAADQTFNRLEARTKLLADQPRMGPRRTDIAAAVRVLVETPYLILYQTSPDTDEGDIANVEIVAVVDGRRDLAALF